MKDILALSDYRRQVAALYARIRSHDDACASHDDFIKARDHLFTNHSQSALTEEQKAGFTGLEYFPYNPAYRFLVKPDFAVDPEIIDIELRDDGMFQIRRVARLHIPFPNGDADLSLFWSEGYGGGLFLPFGDKTNNTTTFGGGRYLLDTIKYADLGSEDNKLILDFNFAYNPSCVYNSLWDCPLAPYENRIDIAIEAGEKLFTK